MTQENQNKIQHDADYEYDTLTNKRFLKDHEYDGIRELDNEMPSWFVWLFVVTIIFSLIYLVRLWVFRSDDLYQGKEFEKEMAQARAATPAPGAETFQLVLLTDKTSLANGKDTWTKLCAVCHLVDGGGLVGPNMTDNYWIHGNTIDDLFALVTNGVPEKGMIPYKDQLSPRQRLEVSSYILNELVGSTPANPKAPEGELME